MLTIMIILAVAYVVLKTLNTTDEFKRRDAAREAREKAEREAAEAAEMEIDTDVIRNDAVDVEEFETVPSDDASDSSVTDNDQ